VNYSRKLLTIDRFVVEKLNDNVTHKTNENSFLMTLWELKTFEIFSVGGVLVTFKMNFKLIVF
jgi:hypothetical protein